jgi:hypothetical protein
MRPNVYTYYTPLREAPDLWAEDTQRKLIDVWRRSWAKRGWNPVVLTEQDAARHPRYPEFKKKFWSLPTEYGHNYEVACFMRWVAVSARGGGMLTDYDVINYSFTPRGPDPEKLIIYSDNPPEGIFLGAVIAPQSLYEGMCQMFFSWEVCENDWNASAKLYHCSDLSLIHRMYIRRDYPKPAWMHRYPGCGLFSVGDWKKAEMVHYGFEMKHHGYWPKYAHIETLRPL